MLKYYMITLSVIFVGTLGWTIGSILSSDALAMATGVLFGTVAGIPAALLVLASSRRDPYEDYRRTARTQQRPNVTNVYLVGAGQNRPGERRFSSVEGRKRLAG